MTVPAVGLGYNCWNWSRTDVSATTGNFYTTQVNEWIYRVPFYTCNSAVPARLYCVEQ